MNLGGNFSSPLVLVHFLAITSRSPHHLWSRKALVSFPQAPHVFVATLFPSWSCTQVVLSCLGFPKHGGLLYASMRMSELLSWPRTPFTPVYVADIYLATEEHLHTPTVAGTWKQWTKQTKPLPSGAHVLVCECRGQGQERDKQEDTEYVT